MHGHVTMDQAKPFPRLSSILRVHLNKLIVRGKGDVKKKNTLHRVRQSSRKMQQEKVSLCNSWWP
jgi:hypothetical protein